VSTIGMLKWRANSCPLSDDEEDETAELLRELEKIKRERAEQKEKEELEKAAIEQDQREKDIALGNPLLMPTKDAESKRR
jgi:protein CWC15